MRTITTLVFVFSFIFHLTAQDKFPFIQENAEWIVYYGTGPDASEMDEGTTVTFSFKKDTIIGNTHYSIMNDTPIREVDKKVYAIDTETGNELLIYDFTLKVGDSFSITVSDQTYSYEVATIDSVKVGNEYRKRIVFAGYFRPWIDGIGSERGPLYFKDLIWWEIGIELFSFNTRYLSYPNNKPNWFDRNAKWIYSGKNGSIEKYQIVRDTFIGVKTVQIVEHKTIFKNGQEEVHPNLYVTGKSEIYLWEHDQFNFMYGIDMNPNATFHFKRDGATYDLDQLNHARDEGLDYSNVEIKYVDTNGESKTIRTRFYKHIGFMNCFILNPEMNVLMGSDAEYTGLRCFEGDSLFFRSPYWRKVHPNDACDLFVSNDDLVFDDIEFSIQPNPATNVIKIDAEVLEIVNLSGQSINFSQNEDKIDISSFKNGIYFLKMNRNDVIRYEKLIKI